MVRQLVMAMVACLLAAATADAASVRAVVDRNQATVGESIAMQVTIEDGKGTVDLSGITGFKTISRGTSSSFNMINGRTSRQLVHNYVLIPLKAGSLTIPAIPVTIDGKAHFTAPIRVTVSEEPPVDSGKRDVYVTAAVSETSPWLGQQIIYTFRLFNAVQIADAKFQAPEFDGFNAEELEDRHSFRTVVNGREFIVTEVTFILVPVKTGTLQIEPAVLQAGLVQRNRRPRPFAGMDAFFGRRELTTRVLDTDPISVRVRALPDAPPGTAFSGLVGRFEISASLEKTDIQVGDSTTLAVTINGSGNIMDAPAPVIPAPEEFKVYADNPEVQVQPGTDGYTGSKTFRTALVPVKPGQYRIDPIVLTYFDAGAGRYRTLSSPAFDLTASPSDTTAADIEVFRAAPGQPPSSKRRVEFTDRDILPLKAGLEALKTRRSMTPLWFGIFLALPVLGFAAARAVVKMMLKEDDPGRIMADRARQSLKTAAGDCADADFLTALYRALVSAIQGRKGIMGTSLTWSEARHQLTDIGWDDDEAAATAGLLETIESLNYSGSPLDGNKRTELLDRTRQAVRRLTR
ncbi:hypothetical protein DSCA_38430 [Desulfosarcina alkanivorans]|uniref:Protein BatD n=1 Tax=Desulfosarcina alkanivorans TaxID=571177 RepID=A0A5K7YND5_9BACT|nr:BatD family protein [Desulfosarcina alkanivorans]BBO69913.1 hypothetical protein DSCA_38430 [Desulfosarcina alkanivorans]